VLSVKNSLGDADQQLREEALAPDQRRSAQIKPIQIEQVERVIEEPVLAAQRSISHAPSHMLETCTCASEGA
jgi:hypothetical protein